MYYYRFIAIVLLLINFQLFGETIVVERDGGVRPSSLKNFIMINIGSKVDFPEDHHINISQIKSIIVRDKALSDRFVEIHLAASRSKDKDDKNEKEPIENKVYRIPYSIQNSSEILEVIKQAQD